jgi:hypothetical protein
MEGVVVVARFFSLWILDYESMIRNRIAHGIKRLVGGGGGRSGASGGAVGAANVIRKTRAPMSGARVRDGVKRETLYFNARARERGTVGTVGNVARRVPELRGGAPPPPGAPQN